MSQGRKCKQPPSLPSTASSLTGSQCPPKETLILWVFASCTSPLSFLGLRRRSCKYQNDNHGSFKMPPSVTLRGGKGNIAGCRHNIYHCWSVLFVFGGGCRGLTKEKQNSSVSKHELGMISFSAALLSTAHKSRAALGRRSVHGPAEP